MNSRTTTKLFSVLLLAVALFAPTVAASAGPPLTVQPVGIKPQRQQAVYLINEARHFMDVRNYPEARRCFTEAFQVGDDSPEILTAVLDGLHTLEKDGYRPPGMATDIVMIQDVLEAKTRPQPQPKPVKPSPVADRGLVGAWKVEMKSPIGLTAFAAMDFDADGVARVVQWFKWFDSGSRQAVLLPIGPFVGRYSYEGDVLVLRRADGSEVEQQKIVWKSKDQFEYNDNGNIHSFTRIANINAWQPPAD